ncbi:hypothetical protein HD554DRAFT_1996662, partial [Boletus coccyginus]
IPKSDTTNCPCCTDPSTPETVRHFLLECTNFARERHNLRNALNREAFSIPYMLSEPSALPHLFKFINSTKRLKDTFGKV